MFTINENEKKIISMYLEKHGGLITLVGPMGHNLRYWKDDTTGTIVDVLTVNGQPRSLELNRLLERKYDEHHHTAVIFNIPSAFPEEAEALGIEINTEE